LDLPVANYVIRIARSATIVALFAVAALLGILSGVLFAFAGDLPEISALDNYNPSTITRVYAATATSSASSPYSGGWSSATTTSLPGCAKRSSRRKMPTSIRTLASASRASSSR